MSVDLLAAALDYAARGWPVIPLWWPENGRCACPSAECTSPGKHPLSPLVPHGLNDATLDADILRQWWQRYPLANIGLRTGVAFDVLDVDGPEALEGIAVVARAAGYAVDVRDGALITPIGAPIWWDGPEVATAHGFHRYVAPTGRTNAKPRVAKLDYRGVGGYVVAPPSLHVTGVRYCWGSGGPDVPLEPLPSWCSAFWTPPPTVAPARTPPPSTRGSGGNVSGLVAKVALAAEGERNTVLHWAACRVGEDHRRRKITAVDAARALDELLIVALRIGLAEREARATLQSGYRTGSEVAA